MAAICPNLVARFVEFKKTLNDKNVEPVRVFKPLTKKQMDDLLLIRGVSEELQTKKVEEALKAKQATEEAKEVVKATETVEKEDA